MTNDPKALIERARDLVVRKGEMSIELWNDKAQCTLAPILHALESSLSENAAMRERLEKADRALQFANQHMRQSLSLSQGERWDKLLAEAWREAAEKT